MMPTRCPAPGLAIGGGSSWPAGIVRAGVKSHALKSRRGKSDAGREVRILVRGYVITPCITDEHAERLLQV